MFNVILNRTDRIESVLPVVEMAMASGEVCWLYNLDQLGQFEFVTQSLVTMVEDLLDGVRHCQVQPGFRLLGVDDHGVRHTLLM